MLVFFVYIWGRLVKPMDYMTGQWYSHVEPFDRNKSSEVYGLCLHHSRRRFVTLLPWCFE